MEGIGFSPAITPVDEEARIAAKRKQGLRILIVILSLVAAPLLWSVAMDRYHTGEAEDAIAATVAACGSGSRFEVARRYTDAQVAFNQLDWEDHTMMQVNLDNQLRVIGCSPY